MILPGMGRTLFRNLNCGRMHALLLAAGLALCCLVPHAKAAEPDSLDYKHPGLPGQVSLQSLPDGSLVYRIQAAEGAIELSPEEFARHLLARPDPPPLLFRFFNITSSWGILWVVLGLAGQLLFALRMIVQWLVSERERRSVVPVVFWWISLAGASLLLVYFIWRKDLVGILGQATGWAIYLRNLVLIHRNAA